MEFTGNVLTELSRSVEEINKKVTKLAHVPLHWPSLPVATWRSGIGRDDLVFQRVRAVVPHAAIKQGGGGVPTLWM